MLDADKYTNACIANPLAKSNFLTLKHILSSIRILIVIHEEILSSSEHSKVVYANHQLQI